jgi:triacylglycerol lipase
MAAELAYESEATIERAVFDEWGFDHCRFIDSDDSQAFVAADREVIIVAFRGTENDLTDWLTDADFNMVKGPLNGKVHEGFYDGLSQIWHSLHNEVIACDPQQRKSLWVTGHSLGAALAALAAARWYEWGRHVSGAYTFGQPRTGDATFRRNFNFAMKASTFRFVNDNDLVTRVPPRALGFSHLGTLKYFTDAGSLEGDASWWQMFLDRWTFHLEGLLDGALEAAQDHSMIVYRQLVEAALGTPMILPFAQPQAAAEVMPMLRAEQKPMLLPRRRAA